MIKRLRLKFIVINMGIATILLSAILGLVFYFTSANLETCLLYTSPSPRDCS